VDLRLTDRDKEEEEKADDNEVFRDLHSPGAFLLQRTRTAIDLRKLGDEMEKDVDGEGPTGLTAPVNPRRNKRPTIAQLRELNRALKDVAPVPLTLGCSKAVIDLSVSLRQRARPIKTKSRSLKATRSELHPQVRRYHLRRWST